MAELSPTESQLIGSRIREARVKRRMSQAELADKAGISLPQISLSRFDPSSGHTGNKRNLSKPV